MADERRGLEWEVIPGTVTGKRMLSPHMITLYRAKVPGGWVLCIDPFGATFYPDPEHKWDGSASPSSAPW
jgi:hypothetical protein